MTTANTREGNTDYDELIPPAISQRELETRDLTTAFYNGFYQFLHANNYTSNDLDQIFEEVETFVDIERLIRTDNGKKSKRSHFARHMLQILGNHEDAQGMEFNAFFDARLKYLFGRTKTTDQSNTVINHMKQLISNLFKS